MDNKASEMVTMPDNSMITFEECMDNLLYTRDFSLYLDYLMALRHKFMIILSVKDTTIGTSNEIFSKIKALGFSKFQVGKWKTYVGIVDGDNVLFNSVNEQEDASIEFSTEYCNHQLYSLSEAHNYGNSKIIINYEDYSLNGRGINIVVFDIQENRVADSVTYDCCIPNPTFYHYDPTFSASYFDNNFYLREKYKKNFTNMYRKSFFSNRKLGFNEISNGIIEPLKDINGGHFGGVCDEHFNFVAGHLKYKGIGLDDRECFECYKVNDSELKYIDEVVIFGGMLQDHPGHLIVESFAERMWWVLKHPEANYRIAVTVQWRGVWGDNIYEFMDAVNIPRNRIIFVDKPTKFKKIIIPDQSIILYAYTTPYEITKEYTEVFDLIRRNCTPSVYKKIYIAKSKTLRGNIIGEDEFISFYQEKGFKIIYPEDYTIKEKAEIFYGADEVVSSTGTNTIFAVFCKPTVKLTLLTRIGSQNFNAQLIVNQTAKIKNIQIVDVDMGFLHKDFSFGINLMCMTNEFRKYVKDTYNEELNNTEQESLKNNLYEYLRYFPKYYTNPTYYNTIKNQNMLTILQNMSEIFWREDFKTDKLNLETNESALRNKVTRLTAESDAYKKQASEYDKKNESLNIKVNKLMAELTEKQDMENELKKQLESEKENCSKLENENISLENRIKILTSYLSVLQQKIKSLSDNL